MEFGLALQNHGDGTSREGLTASADAASRHGWRSVWAVDHMVVPTSESADYGWTLDPLLSLAWIAASYPDLRLATGVLVPPMRDAVQLAKELATLDVLSGGRLTVGVGVGDEEDLGEYTNLGKADRFRVRGAYLDEAIALWRHLWSGSREPFEGRFTTLTDFTFAPLPPQGADLRIISGGRSERALSRVGRITDGLYSSRWGPDDLAARWPAMLATARTNGRRVPTLSTRVRVRFDARPDSRYSVCGSPVEMAAELVRFAEVGVTEFVAVLEAILPGDIERLTARLEGEVVSRFRESWAARPAGGIAGVVTREGDPAVPGDQAVGRGAVGRSSPEDDLAAFIANIRLEDLPGPVLARVQDLLLDAIASALAGRATTEAPNMEAAARVFAGPGESTVIGGGRMALGGATLVNGYEITAATVCDVHRPILCHVTPVVVPAALGIAEGRGSGGSELLAALAAGFETTVRIGLALGYEQFRARGWHSPGVIGPFGGAAAAARLLRLDALSTRHALGLAGSQSAGTFAGLGSAQVKFHQARGAMSGLLAALTAAAGLDAAERILGNPDGGLFATYSDGGDPARLSAGLGKDWTLMGISLRRWPAASALQAVAQAAFELAAEPGLDNASIEQLTVALPEGSYRLNGGRTWHDQLSAFQSAAYIAAVVLHDRRCWLEQFSAERLADPRLRAFVDERVRIEVDDGLPPGGATVSLVRDGRASRVRVDVPGGDPAAPLSQDDLVAKLVLALAGTDLAGPASRIAALVQELPGAASIEPLLAAIREPDQ